MKDFFQKPESKKQGYGASRGTAEAERETHHIATKTKPQSKELQNYMGFYSMQMSKIFAIREEI